MRTIDVAEKTLFAIWQVISAREEQVGFDGLSQAEQVFYAVWMLDAEVRNGGFSQYVFNSSGDHGEFAVTALREVGALEQADICARFFALLPGGRPAADQNARQEQLDEVDRTMGEEAFETACTELEQAYYDLGDDLRDRLLAHARSTFSA